MLNHNIEMAEKEEEWPMETQQEHALMCENHQLMPIDVTCEDCETFICSKCAKEYHKDHDWITISTAATLRTRGLIKSLKNIEEIDIQNLDKKIQRTSQKMKETKKRCETEVKKLQEHYNAIVEKLHKIKEKHEKTFKESLELEIAQLSKDKLRLEEKKNSVLQHVKSMRENSGTMTDISLIKAHRMLTKELSTKVNTAQKPNFLLRHESGDINEAVLESMMGHTLDADQITVTERDSFQWEDISIFVLEAINENTCYLADEEFPYFEQVNKSGEIENEFSIDVNDVCVTDNNDVYVTDRMNNSISRLSPLGSVSRVISTDPLEPLGICQTMDGGLLVTLRDNESDPYLLNSDSRRLVIHVTLTGDVIREYEYQEDGQTRLFILPCRVTQNANTDICVINWTSETNGELMLFSFSGSLKCVYPELNQRDNFFSWSVVCDSHCNLIVSEVLNSSVHLLSPDGKFMRYLLTKNQVNWPTAMSLKNSSLWIGDFKGHVKVFQYI